MMIMMRRSGQAPPLMAVLARQVMRVVPVMMMVFVMMMVSGMMMMSGMMMVVPKTPHLFGLGMREVVPR